MSQKLPFKISSNLKNIIGRELITDDYIAIFELVKNSYDADATLVDIVFKNIKSNKERSSIIIRDDGYGMSYDDIINKWLFVGYSDKKDFIENVGGDFRDKIGSQRIFAGAKGIGRFSCDRLGNKLYLFSKKENEDIIHRLEIDWTQFELNSKDEFQDIEVIYSEVKEVDFFNLKFTNNHGTILIISPINYEWDEKKLIGLKRHLQRLINPAQFSIEQDFSIYIDVEEYLVDDFNKKEDDSHNIINGIIKNVVFERLGIQTTRIYSNIDKKGNKIKTELWDKDKFIFSLEEENLYPLLNVSIKLFYLNPIAKATFTKLMGIQPVRYGSIFLYKNGFKINPYGNDGDDWLGLDRRKTQGMRRYFGNREVMGRIEVSGLQEQIREVSSRDGGVIRTQEFDMLKELFLEKSLKRLEKYVVRAIRWDNPESKLGLKDPDEIKADSLKIINQIIGDVKDENKLIEFNEGLLEIFKESELEKTSRILNNLKENAKYFKTKKEKDFYESQIKTIEKSLNKFRKERKILEEELKLQEEQILFLKFSEEEDKKEILGLQHHIGLATNTIDENMKALKDDIEDDYDIENNVLIDLINDVTYQTKIIQSIVLYATKATFDTMSDLIYKDLVNFIKQYIENVYNIYNKIQLDKKDINISVIVPKTFIFECEFRPLDVIIVLDNLINNSIKAQSNNIKIILTQDLDNEMTFSIVDDGIGISMSDKDRIFDFGYSTTGGSGIGLHHVKKISVKNNWDLNIDLTIQPGVKFIIKVMK